MTKKQLLGLMTAAAVFHPFSAHAQDQANSQGADDAVLAGDIIVTATRQSTALSRVALSISAYDQEKLDVQGVRSIDDVTRMTPGVTFDRSGRSSQISIRGIASTIGAATTAIYIDDTPIQVRTVGNSATNSYPRIFDLERVEVLRGPQGTLFGASSQGGSVRFITPKPNLDHTSVYARAEVSATEGGAASYEGGVAFGAPIVEDQIGFRASAWHRHEGGYVDRYTPVTNPPTPSELVKKNVNSSDAYALRFALGVRLGDRLTVTPSIFHQNEDAKSVGSIFDIVSNPKDQVFRNSYVVDPWVKDRMTLPALLVELDLDSVKLVSNTSYFDRFFSTISDYTYYEAALYGSKQTALTQPGELSIANFSNSQKAFSQEVRLQSNGDGRLNWVVGGFYTRAKQNQFQDIYDPFLNKAILIRTGGRSDVRSTYGSNMLPGDIFFYTQINTVDTQLAGFAQAEYEFVDNLKLTVGARISKTKFNTDVLRDGPLAGGYSYLVAGQSETPITPKVSLSWQADSRNLFYASAAKGYRPGGAQAQLSPIACAADLNDLGLKETPATFKSDSIWSYEIGSKNRLFGNLLSVEASAYLINWKDIQQRVSFSRCGGLFVTNQGSATSKGFDISIQLRPAAGLTLSTAVGYNKAEFDQTIVQGASTLRFKGDSLPVRPFTLAASGQYDFQGGKSVHPYVRADYQYLGKADDRNPKVFGYDPGLGKSPLSAVNNLKLRAGAKFNSVDLAFFVDNVLNDSPVNWGRIAGRASTIRVSQAVRPRTFGLVATIRD